MMLRLRVTGQRLALADANSPDVRRGRMCRAAAVKELVRASSIEYALAPVEEEVRLPSKRQVSAFERLQSSWNASSSTDPLDGAVSIAATQRTAARADSWSKGIRRPARWGGWPLQRRETEPLRTHQTNAFKTAENVCSAVVKSGRVRRRERSTPSAARAPSSRTWTKKSAFLAIKVWKEVVNEYLALAGIDAPSSKAAWLELWMGLDFSTAHAEVIEKLVVKFKCSEHLLRRLKDLSTKASFHLVEANTGIVNMIVRQLVRDAATVGDARACGLFHLHMAVWHFDSAAGCQFSTYAFSQVRGSVQRERAQHGSVLNTPVRYKQLRESALKLIAEPSERDFDVEEVPRLNDEELSTLAQRLEVSQVALRTALTIRHESSAETTVMTPDGGSVVCPTAAEGDDGDSIEAEHSWQREKELGADIDIFLSKLPTQELITLQQRYGLVNSVPMTSKSIAKANGLKSRSLVHYRVNKALKVLHQGAGKYLSDRYLAHEASL